MTTSNLNVAHSSDGVSSQLSLPTGPVGLVRPRHARTDGDRDFMARAFSVRAGGLAATAVYRCLAYHCSKSERRIAYPAQATVAEYCEITVRHVRRVLRKLESDGLIVCEIRKKGAHPSHYSLTEESRSGHDVPLEADMRSANKEKEGIKNKQKALSVNDDAQTINPGAVEEVEIPEEAICLPFPSQEREQERASAPVPKETVFVNENQVKLLFKLQRKLGYRADDGQAGVFDGLEHADRKRILDKLLAEEQLAAAQGKVPAPPKAAPSPRHEFPLPVARKTVRERPTCSEHRWTPAASDGVQNCYGCDAEKTLD